MLLFVARFCGTLKNYSALRKLTSDLAASFIIMYERLNNKNKSGFNDCRTHIHGSNAVEEIDQFAMRMSTGLRKIRNEMVCRWTLHKTNKLISISRMGMKKNPLTAQKLQQTRDFCFSLSSSSFIMMCDYFVKFKTWL